MVTAAHSCAQEGDIGKKVSLLDQADEALPPWFPGVTVTGPLDEQTKYLSYGHIRELAVFQAA